jgi:hypothetical protein
MDSLNPLLNVIEIVIFVMSRKMGRKNDGSVAV